MNDFKACCWYDFHILIQFFVEEEMLDSSTLSSVLLTHSGLQMRELEIQMKLSLKN